jgi:hypothetical protein
MMFMNVVSETVGATRVVQRNARPMAALDADHPVIGRAHGTTPPEGDETPSEPAKPSGDICWVFEASSMTRHYPTAAHLCEHS